MSAAIKPRQTRLETHDHRNNPIRFFAPSIVPVFCVPIFPSLRWMGNAPCGKRGKECPIFLLNPFAFPQRDNWCVPHLLLKPQTKPNDMKNTTTTQTWKPSLGSFSKALPGAIALNFSESGGANCSARCQALKMGVCYAIHTERMKPSVQTSGERKRKMGFAPLCRAYQAQIEKRIAKGDFIPWIRFSTFGSVPNRPLSGEEMKAFADLVKSFPEGTPVHFPVETRRKAERFRAIAVAFDLNLVVRESAQSDAGFRQAVKAGEQVSRIVYKGETKRERLENARAIAKRSKGKIRVCPAIASTILRTKPVKCGQCTLCSRGDVTGILYPQH